MKLVARPLRSNTEGARPLRSNTEGARPLRSNTEGARPLGSNTLVAKDDSNFVCQSIDLENEYEVIRDCREVDGWPEDTLIRVHNLKQGTVYSKLTFDKSDKPVYEIARNISLLS